MSSEMFESLEYEFTNISAALSTKISSNIPNYSGEQRKQAIRAAEKQVVDAEELVNHMEIELRNQPAPFKTKLQNRAKGYRSEVEKLKRDLRKLNESLERGDLLGAGVGAPPSASNDSFNDPARGRVLGATDKLNATSQRIANAVAIGQETEDMGADALAELARQEEALKRSSQRLYETDSTLNKAHKLLNTMARKAAANKIILIVIILLLIGINILIAYLKFIK